jgi:hypothetical protein
MKIKTLWIPQDSNTTFSVTTESEEQDYFYARIRISVLADDQVSGSTRSSGPQLTSYGIFSHYG